MIDYHSWQWGTKDTITTMYPIILTKGLSIIYNIYNLASSILKCIHIKHSNFYWSHGSYLPNKLINCKSYLCLTTCSLIMGSKVKLNNTWTAKCNKTYNISKYPSLCKHYNHFSMINNLSDHCHELFMITKKRNFWLWDLHPGCTDARLTLHQLC